MLRFRREFIGYSTIKSLIQDYSPCLHHKYNSTVLLKLGDNIRHLAVNVICTFALQMQTVLLVPNLSYGCSKHKPRILNWSPPITIISDEMPLQRKYLEQKIIIFHLTTPFYSERKILTYFSVITSADCTRDVFWNWKNVTTYITEDKKTII